MIQCVNPKNIVDGSCFRISDKTIDKSSQDHGIMNTGGPS